MLRPRVSIYFAVSLDGCIARADGVLDWLDGGQLIRQGLSEHVVDDMALSMVPIVLGNGRRLFDASLPESKWALVSSRAFASGRVQNRYRSAEPVAID